MAQQSLNAQYLGLAAVSSSGANSSSLALNTPAAAGFSSTWLAYGFMPTSSDTVTSVRVYISGVTGTLQTTDCVCDIYSDASGHPNASLGSVSLGSAPTGAGWVTFSFGTPVSVTGGSQYWVVLRNANATDPTTNYPTYGWVLGLRPVLYGAANGSLSSGWVKLSSTNSGTAWGSASSGIASYRIGYGSGAYQGQTYSGTLVSTDKIFSTNEAGVKLTLPGSSSLLYNVAGISLPLAKSGSPAGFPTYHLYVGASSTSVQAATTSYPNGMGTNMTGMMAAYFSTTQQIPGGSTIRVTAADTATDSSGACYILSQLLTTDTDTNSLPLAPFAGTAIYTKLSGGVWTDDNSHIPLFGLLLDSTGEFSVSGGSYLGGPQQTLVYWDG